MEEYKDLEDSYHELIVEHGKKRKIVQSLLLEIDDYKEKSNAAHQNIKEAQTNRTNSKHILYERENEQIMLEEQKTCLLRDVKDSFSKKNLLQSKIDLQHKKAYDTIMDYANNGFPFLYSQIKGMAEESSELNTTILCKEAKVSHLTECLRQKLDEREKLRDECFDIEIILHDIKREISAAKSGKNKWKQLNRIRYDEEVQRLLEQKEVLENKRKQLVKDLERAMDEKRLEDIDSDV